MAGYKTTKWRQPGNTQFGRSAGAHDRRLGWKTAKTYTYKMRPQGTVKTAKVYKRYKTK